ncbi:MAG: tetratricopeptide repeat protein [Lachnospiraceae bacterium]|nr:tetratricopeptide repeat protein [Lachnospiraceae bacterium]
MNGIWKILGIDPTVDKKVIKKAYHALLKDNNPEDNPAGFIQLREAYEKALVYAESENNQQDNWYDIEEDEEETASFTSINPKEQKFMEWCQKVLELYKNYERRNQVENWRELLYEDIPYQIDYYEKCRLWLYTNIMQPYNSIYMDREARLVLDGFFSYSATPLERVRSKNSWMLERINRKIKLCEKIEFNKIIINKNYESDDIDNFLVTYERMLTAMTKNNTSEFKRSIKSLKDRQIMYLPLTCIDIALNFHKYSNTQIEDKINQLITVWGNVAEVKLLNAEYSIYKKETEKAKGQLAKLYREVPVKNYNVIYQMVCCCQKVSMYYEAYMLVKQLTWLNPEPFMNDMADAIYEEMENIYLEKEERGEEISDLEYIHLCRMYLRSNREEDAVKVLKKVKDTSLHYWEYEIAHCLCIFYEEAKKEGSNLYLRGEGHKPESVIPVEPAVPVMEFLEKYPKEQLNEIEKLEWEELKGRYLFEQRKYEECENKCNELLEEYPLSYPILLLRGYADYNNLCFSRHDKLKKYLDFDFLIDALPNRTEARLAGANIAIFCECYERACRVLEPIKEKVPDQYEYYCILPYRYEEDWEKFIDGLTKLFTKAKECELSIPPISKYRLLDLHNIYVQACVLGFHIWEKSHDEWRKFFRLLEELKDAAYNHPEQYVDLYWLYEEKSNKQEEALDIAKQRLENARTEKQKEDANLCIYRICCDLGKLEEAEKAATGMPKEHSRISLGRSYHKAGNNEKAIYYLMKDRDIFPGERSLYRWLGMAYYEMGKYDESIEAFQSAIKIIRKDGDYSSNFNFYLGLYMVYKKKKMWEEAIDSLNLMKKYTCLKEIKAKYPEKIRSLFDDMFAEYSGVEEENMYSIKKIIRKTPKELRAYAYGTLVNIFKTAGKTETAIQTAQKGIEDSDYTGDYFENCNLYRDLYFVYIDKQRWDEAIETAKLMKEHTNTEAIKAEYPCFIAYASIWNGDYETAYIYFKMVKENDSYSDMGLNTDINILLSNYGMGNYEEASSQAIELAYSFEDPGQKQTLFLMSLRSCFMMDGKVDKELACKIEKELLDIRKTKTGKEGCSYNLAQIYMAMGKIEQYEYYKNLALESAQKTEEVDLDDIVYMNSWCYAFEKKFDKAVEEYEKRSESIGDKCSNSYIEYSYFKKMANLSNCNCSEP